MTENEAIKACNTIVYVALSGIPRAPLNMTKNELAEAIKMAVKALEEVRVLQDRFVDVSLRLGEYMAIGTPEECREAMEKQNRKPVKDPYGTRYIWKAGYCPVCGCGVTARWDYCQCCGQKLRWSDYEREE